MKSNDLLLAIHGFYICPRDSSPSTRTQPGFKAQSIAAYSLSTAFHFKGHGDSDTRKQERWKKTIHIGREKTTSR